MTIAPKPAPAPLSAPSKEAVDPTYRQIRDLVYKVSGIYKADEKLYLLVDGCGRRMKEIKVRTPVTIGTISRQTPAAMANSGNC
jgi:hypothetical protein